MDNFHHIQINNQIIALFLSVAFGHLLGKVRLGSFELGTTNGTLIIAILISIIGGHLDAEIQNLFFMLFLFAVGYEGGPQILYLWSWASLKHIVLTIFLACSGIFTIVVCAKIFHLDQGTSAGILAGSFTHSGLMGTASDAIDNLDISPMLMTNLQANLANSFALTYLFGMVVTILFCINGIEFFYKRSIRFDAIEKESQMHELELESGVNGYDDYLRQPYTAIVVANLKARDNTVAAFEQSFEYQIVIHKIKRQGQFIEVDSDVILHKDDQLLLFGKSELMVTVIDNIADQISNPDRDWDIKLASREIILKNKKFTGISFKYIIETRNKGMYKGLHLLKVTRNGNPVIFGDEKYSTQIGDVYEVYGFEDRIIKLSATLGEFVSANEKTDFICLGVGLILGTIIGIAKFNLFGIPIQLGGVGVLVLGLFFGWLNHKRNRIAYIPPSTVQFIKDFGLTTFIAGVGLSTGEKALESFLKNGIEILIIGITVSVVSLFMTYLFGRYILKYRNTAVFGAALMGARNSNPALGLLLERAGNFVPTAFFTITYAVANIVFTLLGPVIIHLT